MAQPIDPAVWYGTAEVRQLLGDITARQLRRLPIPRTPIQRGKDLYKGSDLLNWLESRGPKAAATGGLRRVG